MISVGCSNTVKNSASIDAQVPTFCSDPLKVLSGIPKDLRCVLLLVNAVDFKRGTLYADC
jgi:hypothetical protein